MNKITKTIDVQSCIICERDDDKHMIMTISSKVGSFEFAFPPQIWAQLGDSAGWFEVRREPMRLMTNGTKESE